MEMYLDLSIVCIGAVLAGKTRENRAEIIRIGFFLSECTDYGRQRKPFFIEIQNFWAWADKFMGIWGILGWTISTHFGTVGPLSMFSIIVNLTIIFTK